MAPPSTAGASPVSPSKQRVVLSGGPILPMSAPDPCALLDSLDRARSRGGVTTAASGNNSDFDPIDFLNKHYTTESALCTQLPGLRDAVSDRMQRLDDKISNALQRQSETAETTRRHIQDAKASVSALEHRITQVKEKASQSERAVLEITKDMKRLDCAKKHLQKTITTLKQLHMLIGAVEQLRLTCIEKPFPDYKTAAHLIDATGLLLEHFDAYTAKVEQMRRLNRKVNELQEELRTSLVRGFRIVSFGYPRTLEMEGSGNKIVQKKISFLGSKSDDDGEDHEEAKEPPVMTADVMEGGILLIDALGTDVRNRFIHQFCQDQLSDYMKKFEPPEQKPKEEHKRVSSFKVVEMKTEPEKPAAGLDQIEKRFVWFREVLKQVEEKFPMFPSDWNLQASMARHFLRLTRDHILALLDGPRKDPDSNNATILLKALQKTIIFEKEMSAWLERECGAVFRDDNEMEGDQDDAGAKTDQASIEPIIGVASGAYESYMNPYIELEEQSMDEQLVEALEDRTVDTRGERPVFTSSTNLFVYIKGSITRCTALTKGNAFYLLYQAFKDSLRKYAQILNGKLPQPVIPSSTGLGGITISGGFGGKQDDTTTVFRIPKGDEVMVCHVITTCEYCADTMEALEDLIRDTIDDEYKTKIDMMEDQEQFHEITAKAIRVLVSGATNRVDNAFKTMSSINWGACDVVGEESTYVRSIHEEIQPFAVAIRKVLPTSYFRSFCDKFGMSFTTNYYETVIRLKRITEPGTQQLLLDVYSLKTLFLKLPVLEVGLSPSGQKAVGTGGSTIAPAMYVKMVQKQFGKIETLLKLVGTPTDLLIDNFKVQWVGGTATELQTVMGLKGIKRGDQAKLLEKFGVDPVNARAVGVTGAAIISERIQTLQDQGTTAAAKVNSDLNQMRQKVDDFRLSFR